MRLTTKDLDRIVDAIGRAEQRTSGEIVCALTRRASDYAYVPPLWAAFFALVSPWPLAVFTQLTAKEIYADADPRLRRVGADRLLAADPPRIDARDW